jgi:hypothetical protein
MRITAEPMSWVVYRLTMMVRGKPFGSNAVCEQGEWEAMERVHPGQHSLIQAGIANEGEAERLARSGSVEVARTNAAEMRSTTHKS